MPGKADKLPKPIALNGAKSKIILIMLKVFSGLIFVTF
jgi:hypothetical protein